MSTDFCMALTTAPSREVAQTLAEGLLTTRIAACVQVLPGVHSSYWWEGKLETSEEVLLLIKTAPRHWEKLEAYLEEAHPYEVSELIQLPIEKASAPYLNWLNNNIL